MGSTLARRRRLTGAEREAQIRDVATAEFAARGYRGASMNAIAARAGVTKPLLYVHYDSKDALHLACLRALVEPLVARVTAAVAGGGPPAELPTAVLDAIFRALADDRRAWALLTDRTIPAEGPVAAAAGRYRGRLAALARSGTADLLAANGVTDREDLDVATQVWIGTVDTLVAWWLAHPDESADAMAARCRRLVATVLR